MNFESNNMEELEEAIAEKENYDLDEVLESSFGVGCDSLHKWGDH